MTLTSVTWRLMTRRLRRRGITSVTSSRVRPQCNPVLTVPAKPRSPGGVARRSRMRSCSFWSGSSGARSTWVWLTVPMWQRRWHSRRHRWRPGIRTGGKVMERQSWLIHRAILSMLVHRSMNTTARTVQTVSWNAFSWNKYSFVLFSTIILLVGTQSI